MFLLKYSAQGHGLKEGSWYNLDPKLFDGIQYQATRPSDSGGAFLRGILSWMPNSRPCTNGGISIPSIMLISRQKSLPEL